MMNTNKKLSFYLFLTVALWSTPPNFYVLAFQNGDTTLHSDVLPETEQKKRESEIDIVQVENGGDLSGCNLTVAKINFSSKIIKDVHFNNSDLRGANLEETDFVRCWFTGANLTNARTRDSTFNGCDFTDAVINGISVMEITPLQLKQTSNYKHKVLNGAEIYLKEQNDLSQGQDLIKHKRENGLSFSGFDLSDSEIYWWGDEEEWRKISFENATINGSCIYPMSYEQLASTIDFRTKRINGKFSEINFENVDFSHFNLTNTDFFGCNFRNANFTDAVITGCFLLSSQGLTIDQIKSTWNYKSGNMQGIELPREIKYILDKEQFFSSQSYKEKRLSIEEYPIVSTAYSNYKFYFPYEQIENWDLSGMDLRHSVVAFVLSRGANFSGAQIDGVRFVGPRVAIRDHYSKEDKFNKEQLESTASYKNKQLKEIYFSWVCNLDNVDFSQCNLSGCSFETDLTRVNFSDAVITNCHFEQSAGLTLDQIQSTWNYKTGNREGIVLPKGLQAQLDAEKSP